MATKRKQQDLIDRLHANGLRKRLAKTIAGGDGGRRRAEAVARQTLEQLRTASETIRDEVLQRDGKRSAAAKKAARTRKRNAEKRSAAAKKAAKTRTSAAGKGTRSRASSAGKATKSRATARSGRGRAKKS